ncbi:hypothetical protein MRX96_022495 [Rhipicephalus microplus]
MKVYGAPRERSEKHALPRPNKQRLRRGGAQMNRRRGATVKRGLQRRNAKELFFASALLEWERKEYTPTRGGGLREHHVRQRRRVRSEALQFQVASQRERCVFSFQLPFVVLAL